MGFVTALYQNSTPLVQSSVFFRSFSSSHPVNDGGTAKYKTVLEDGGTVQIAKLPQGAPENAYDNSAGAYASTCTISAGVKGNDGQYIFGWHKEGTASRTLLM
jgi:endo-1,3(4)-beta-glucanase